MKLPEFFSLADRYNVLKLFIHFGDIGMETERMPPEGKMITHIYRPTLRCSNGGGKYDRRGFGSDLYNAVRDIHDNIEGGAWIDPALPCICDFVEEAEVISLPSDDGSAQSGLDILKSGNMIGIQTIERRYPDRIVPVWLGDTKHPLLQNLWQNAEETFEAYQSFYKYVKRQTVPMAQLNAGWQS